VGRCLPLFFPLLFFKEEFKNTIFKQIKKVHVENTLQIGWGRGGRGGGDYFFLYSFLQIFGGEKSKNNT
jgi:hypothetical protein